MSGLEDEDNSEPEGEEEIDSGEEESEDAEEEFSAELDDDESFTESDEDLKAVDDALTHKEQNARALAIRRAIEERLEAKRLSRDLDYLDLDLDTDDD